MLIPNINFESAFSSDDNKFYQDTLEQELVNRLLLSIGQGTGTLAFGIVDTVKSTDIDSSQISRPVVVIQNPNSPLKVNVNSGWVVFESGVWTKIDAMEEVTLIDETVGVTNFLIAEYKLVDGGQNRKTVYNTNAWTLRVKSNSQFSDPVKTESEIKTVSLTDWNDSNIFTIERKKNVVVLASIKVVNSITIDIDMSNTSYSFIRPWFSIVDTAHRSKIGTGSVTDQNPHGLSFNDLTSSLFTIYQQVLSTGMVFAKDIDVRGVTGYKCTQEFDQAELKIDYAGDLTKASPIGGSGAKYLELSAFPVSLGTVWRGTSPAKALAADFIKGSNIIVISNIEEMPNSTDKIYVEFFRVGALEPTTDISSSLLTFGTVRDNEFIVSGGLVYKDITNPTYSVDLSGAFARKYRILLNSSGALIRTPQILFDYQTLNSMGLELTSFATTMVGPAKIKVGLTRANNVSGMEVKIRVSGIDTTNTPVTEELIFNNSNWLDNPVPSLYEEPKQFLETAKVFNSVTFIQVVSRANDGINSSIMVWAESETQTDDTYNDLCPVAEIFWNGQALSSIKDIRPVNYKFEQPRKTKVIDMVGKGALDASILLSEMLPAINMPSKMLFSEDFNEPRYLSTATGTYDNVPAWGLISVNDLSSIYPNDAIQLKTGKTIVALGSNANANLGQWNIEYGNLETTVSNMISAINNTTFNSGSIAVVGAAANLAKVTRNDILDARGNTAIIKTVASIGDAMGLVGFQDGVDPFGEIFMDRFVDGIEVPAIPAISEYDTSSYRVCYKTRAIAVPTAFLGTQKFLVILQGTPSIVPVDAIRIRGAAMGDPVNWMPPATLTPTAYSTSAFVITFSEIVYKIQLEVFCSSTGLAVYLINPNI